VTSAPSGPAAAIEKALAGLGLGYESPRPGAYLVRLPGQHKLATMTWLIVGAHSLHVEAFFCRQPDENHAAFYRFLLERGGRMFGVHFALDETGDVYLVGRLPLASISPDEIDRIGYPQGARLADQARREPGQPAGLRPPRGRQLAAAGRARRPARGRTEGGLGTSPAERRPRRR
jgi:hypothetical protein